MTQDQLNAAVQYNTKKNGSLWKQAELPFPLSNPDTPPTTNCFALLVAQFQVDHKLSVDGMLGSATLSAIRAAMVDQGETPDTPPGNETPIPPATPPARLGVSNAIYVGGVRIQYQPEVDGYTCSNWLDDEETHFKCRTRAKAPVHICLHESVTTSVASTVRILDSKNYGVHFMIGPDGHITQHNDPVTEQPVHANQLNSSSVGIEIVNPYSPRWMTAPWNTTIPATWWTWVPKGAKRAYVVPRSAQLQALVQLVAFLTKTISTIPHVFPTKGYGPTYRKLAGYKQKAKPKPGIVAHADFSGHADGRYPLQHLISHGE